jgi:hypothetical protein
MTLLLMVSLIGCGDDSSPVDGGGGLDAPASDATAPDGAGLDATPDDGPSADATTPPPLPDWATRYGTYTSNSAGYDSPADATQTSDRGYLITTSGQWVVALDSAGERRWDLALPGVRLRAAGALPSGGAVLLANEDSTDDTAFFRLVLSADGEVVSRTRYSSPAEQRIFMPGSASFRPDGSAFARGFLRQLATDVDALPWLVAIANDGTILWEQRLTSDNASIDAIAVRAPSGFAIGGADREPNAWVASADESGALEWSRSFGGTASVERVVDLATRPDGGLIVLAETDGFGAGGVDVWVVALDALGAIEWQRSYGSAGEDRGTTIAVRSGGYTFSGRLDGRAWLVGLAADGAVVWERTYEPPSGVVGSASAIPTDDGGSLLTGAITVIDSFLAPADVWALHVDTEGLVEGCAIVQTPTPSATSSTDATATDVAVVLETLTPHTGADEAATPETTDSYVDVHCGPGESTPWGDAGFLESCSCPAGQLCVGPATGCGHGLTCVGRTGSARCSVRCGTDANCPSSGCTVINVGGTNLGGWCQ